MESNERYHARRAAIEATAAARAVTPEARERRLALAQSFARKAGLVPPDAGMIFIAQTSELQLSA